MRRDRRRWMQAGQDGLRYGSGAVSGPQLVLSELVVVLFTGAASLFASLGFGLERRSHFGCRVLLLGLVAPSLVLVVAGAVELHLLPEHTGAAIALLLLSGCLPALMLVGAVLYRGLRSRSATVSARSQERRSSTASRRPGARASARPRPPSSCRGPVRSQFYLWAARQRAISMNSSTGLDAGRAGSSSR